MYMYIHMYVCIHTYILWLWANRFSFSSQESAELRQQSARDSVARREAEAEVEGARLEVMNEARLSH